MANINDYLKWRGDLTFQADAFNSIDALMFSLLSYVNLDSALSKPANRLTIREAATIYFQMNKPDEKEEEKDFISRVPFLLRDAGESARYADIEMSDYENIVDTDSNVQMAAITFHLPDGTDFVAFRGTDSTIVGWKEDFRMSLGATEGQKLCAQYIDRIAETYCKPIRTGGHSKGANFAQYAAVFCSLKTRERITEVWSMDGPGLHESLKADEAFDEVNPRIIRIVPEQSMIGMIYSDDDEDMVVKKDVVNSVISDGHAEESKGPGRLQPGIIPDEQQPVSDHDAAHDMHDPCAESAQENVRQVSGAVFHQPAYIFKYGKC